MTKSAISLMPTLTLVCLLLMGSAFAGDKDKRDDHDRRGDHDRSYDLTHINPRYMITPEEAFDWAYFKAQGGPTYQGSPPRTDGLTL
ncbi:MAG: hypothetical protein WA188_20855 [Terriglobales bacterium]